MSEDILPTAEGDDVGVRREQTLARLAEQIDWYERSARRNNFGHKTCKIVAIISAAAVTVLAAASMPALLVASLGAVVVAVQGIQEVVQFQANWINSGRAKEALKRERALYMADAGPYARANNPDRMLAERTEAVASMELDSWTESQLSEAKATSS